MSPEAGPGDGAADRSAVIFGNPVPAKARRAAERKKAAFARRYGDDSGVRYELSASPNATLGPLFGLEELVLGGGGKPIDGAKGVAIGAIRMGYGHYRPAMAIASAAAARGLVPYWMNLLAYGETTGAKVIAEQNRLYSMGSRWSQKYPLFDKLVWEPLNYEGFKKLSYNAGDQKVSELFAPVLGALPRDLPFVGTHSWASQAAVHAGMTRVVNMMVDNWPMALHLAEGSIHTVQGPSSWFGYRALAGFGGGGTALKMMPPGSLKLTGHVVDHELVANAEADCARRLARVRGGKARRLLLSVGGAGAQRELLARILAALKGDVEAGKVAILLNVGDHRGVWEGLARDLPWLGAAAVRHFDDFGETKAFCAAALDGEVAGVHAFLHEDIFAAVYATNLLMRCADVLATKPSELAYYPVPKLFLKRIGGHEAWGAIRGAELGDGTIECRTPALLSQALELLFRDDELLPLMCDSIVRQKSIGTYDGAYRVLDLATGKG
ncbi:MAG: hypothetical protein JNG85_11135 [Spirochaetaceae bacterium]|nr:hypothetical protein [Spirochaetaceae bacterium]